MIQIDMEMPDCCDGCPLIAVRNFTTQSYCYYLFKTITNRYEKLSDCPLQGVTNETDN